MDELIPIIAMLLTLGPAAIFVISFTPIGKALTSRLKGDNDRLDERLAEFREELRRELLDEQSAQLEELHERLDFAERLLTGNRSEAKDLKRISTPV